MAWDVRGRWCVVTGATSGIGRETAFALGRRGAHLILVSRDPSRLDATASALRTETGAEVAVISADLSERAGVDVALNGISARIDRLDVLINNAGAMFATRELTSEGVERTWALNHLGYFRLTRGLEPLLLAAGAARVVSVASDAHRGGSIHWDDLTLDGAAWWQGFPAYCQSKLANVLFSAELGRRLADAGVTTAAVHPGFVDTGFNRNNGQVIGAIMNLGSRLFARSPSRGAETVIWAATAPELAGATGRYYADLKAIAPSSAGQDGEAAARLWALSEASG